jgi:hypothetical protein
MGSRNSSAESAGKDRASGLSADRLFLILVAVWALAMIAPGLQRVIDSLGSFGLSVDNDGNITDVIAPFSSPAESPAASAGIVPSDRIDLKAMRCIPINTPRCASLVAVLGGLGGTQFALPYRQINLAIKPQFEGPDKSVHLESVPAPLKPAERAVLLADTVVGIVVIVIAFWLVWTRPSWMTWGLFLYVIWINPGQSFTYYALLQRWPLAVLAQELAEALAQGAAFAGLLIFALRFPNDRTEPRWRKVQWAVPLLAITITVLTLLGFRNMFGQPTERITELTFLAGLAVDALVLLVLLERRRSLPPLEEKRMRWVIWGCAIGLPAYIFAELCQSADLFRHLWGFSPSQAFIGLLYLPNGVLAYFASQAVWQRRVVRVWIPLRHGTILVVLSLALGVPIFQLHEKLTNVEEGFRLPGWVWPLVLAPIFLLLMQRLHEIGVELVDRVFNRQFHYAQRQLKATSEEIAHAGCLEDIDHLLVESTARALCLSSCAVFRCQGKVFRRSKDAKGWGVCAKEELRPESDAIALRSLEVGEPVRLNPEDSESLELPAGMEAPCLSVPVSSGIPEATAVLLLGPHATGNDIDADEREMLEKLAARAAAGYERVVARLLTDEVAKLKAEVVALRNGVKTEPAHL